MTRMTAFKLLPGWTWLVRPDVAYREYPGHPRMAAKVQRGPHNQWELIIFGTGRALYATPFRCMREADALARRAIDDPDSRSRPKPRGRYGLWGRSLDDFTREHADRIDQIIRDRVREGRSDVPGLPLLPPGHENDERARWVHHDEHLRQWARREGVKI